MSTSIEQKLRNRIEELEAQLSYERELHNEGNIALNYSRLHDQFGLTQGQCELMRILLEAYPRPVTVGFINDNLSSIYRCADERNDKIVDVYIHRIRKSMRAHTDETIVATLRGGWRLLTTAGVELLRSTGVTRTKCQVTMTRQAPLNVQEKRP